MEQPSALERLAGALPVEIAGTALAVLIPWPGALLPVLTNSLAHGRAQKRIADAIQFLNEELEKTRDKVQTFSDAQYRLTGGIVAAIFETIDEEKLRMLKAAVLNVARSDYLGGFEAQVYSRILRDISAAEVRFLVRHRDARAFSFADPSTPENGVSNTLASPLPVFLDKRSLEGAVAIGLINLGLLVRSASEGLASDTGAYVMSPLVTTLLALLTE